MIHNYSYIFKQVSISDLECIPPPIVFALSEKISLEVQSLSNKFELMRKLNFCFVLFGQMKSEI